MNFYCKLFFAHEFHEFTRIYVLCIKGDLLGRTNFHEFKHCIRVISATD